MTHLIPYPRIKRGDLPMMQSSRLGVLIVWVVLALCVVFCGCRRSKVSDDKSDVLLMIRDSVLTKSDVVGKIPVGIDPADSVALFRAIVDGWIKSNLLSEFAENKLGDITEIERKVADYRNRLIVDEYLKKMREGRQFSISEDSVRGYYEKYKKDMIAESPLVKGIFIKIPENSGVVEDVRRCLFDASDASIDEIEKKWMAKALQYEYFENDWIDWTLLADQIPYRFYDPDAFLSSTSNFETSCNGTVYLFHIDSYLPSGSPLPYEFASRRITSLLEQDNIAKYERNLMENLVNKAIKENNLVVVAYDPIKKVYKEK